MSFSFAKQIPTTQGLIFYLDPGNKNSYTGTGDRINNISKESSTGILYNTPTFNTNNGGYLSFNGTDEYILGSTVSDTLLDVGTSGEVTIEVFIKVNSAPTNVTTIFQYGTNTNFNYGSYAFIINEAYYLGVGAGNSGFLTSAATIGSGEWCQCVAIISSSNKNIYINGVLEGTHTKNIEVKSQNNWSIASLGSNLGVQTYLNCDIGLVRIYNRALSNTEVLNNYNFSKSRFGL